MIQNISKPYKRTILSLLILPLILLIVGIYHGLMQVIYRAGVIHKSEVLHLNYYQGLTLHGVINAVVLTTFFGVAFGHAIMTSNLKKEPAKWSYKLSMWLMYIGTLMDAYAMLTGSAQALYTFYAPLKASPIFYLGTAILVVGSWVAFWGWIPMWFEWKRENPTKKMPLGVLGIFTTFVVWQICTLPAAVELLVYLLPWSMGWVSTVNVPLTRMLFWMFGHALVYFWLLPAYTMFYTMVPKLAGGKLYSDNAARLAFMLFILLSVPVGIHHQFSEPVFSPQVKFFEAVLTYGVALPSFMTAFNIAASLEFAGRKHGATSILGWLWKLPYFKKDNYMFGYLICGLIIFIFGGLSGIVNASYSLNQVVHNTAWVPGHFHMTVAGPVFLSIIGMSLMLYSQFSGKEVRFKTFATIVPYIWMLGIVFFSHGLMAGGLMGEPRRTNMGTSYTDPNNPLFAHHLVPTTTLTLIGGIIMTTAALLYFISFFGTVFSKSKREGYIDLPITDVVHEEKPVPIFMNMKPWIIMTLVLVLFAYVPAIMNIVKYSGPGAKPYHTESPTPIESQTAPTTNNIKK